jgi:DNA helicase-2/ATP-dependent DNA helicase PcrA
MAMCEAAELARNPRGAMIAPAGCGKTHVIATAVAKYGGGRELILTHTHAGVDALRGRMARMGVPAKAYYLDTIAGWALRLAAAFPGISRLQTTEPLTNEEYSGVYLAAARLLGLRPIREIIRASYSGTFIDEYQDCTVTQHGLTLALLDILPCRIVGDPLQGIFDFGDNEAIRWDEHVMSAFDPVAGPTKPWRWAGSNPALGEWLFTVRDSLENGQLIDMRDAPVRWVDSSDTLTKAMLQRKACLDAGKADNESAVAIHQWPNQCHDVAKGLNGKYSCVEAIDAKDLYEAARSLDTTTGYGRAVIVLDFAGKCMTQVKTTLKPIRTAFEAGRPPNVRNNVEAALALLAVAKDDSLASIKSALDALVAVKKAVVYRKELLGEMRKAIRVVVTGEAKSLEEAAWIVRNRSRRLGRIMPRYAVGTTKLIKGLEFDHAVVLDADTYDAKNLYVALTRGSKSLTVVSQSLNFMPTEPPAR